MDSTIIGAWAISGPEFLGLYAVAFLATAVVFERRRRRILDPAVGNAPDIDDLDPVELAYLAHGGRDARVIALLDLERRDVIRIDSATARRVAEAEPEADGSSSRRAARRERKEWLALVQQESELAGRATTLVANGVTAPVGSSAVERQLAEVAHNHGECTLEALVDDPSVDEAERSLHATLVERGYLLDEDDSRRLRWARAVWVPLVLLGVARLAAGLAADRPVGYLGMALVGTVWFAAARRIPTTPRRIEEQLEAAATEERETEVQQAFSIDASTPPDQRDLTGLAVLGVVALWAMSSPYAVALAVPYPTPTGGGGWFGGGCGDGCGGCGGCG